MKIPLGVLFLYINKIFLQNVIIYEDILSRFELPYENKCLFYNQEFRYLCKYCWRILCLEENGVEIYFYLKVKDSILSLTFDMFRHGLFLELTGARLI